MKKNTTLDVGRKLQKNTLKGVTKLKDKDQEMKRDVQRVEKRAYTAAGIKAQ